VLKIDATDLPAVVLGDSAKVEIGDVVLAIGSPLGFSQTVTMGIVSAKGRSIHPGLLEDFIQTDASINQGNSGGALIDAEGRLIGINTAIATRSGDNIGIGFAVPINLARNIMEQLIGTGRVVRGYLGVQIQPMTEDLADYDGVKKIEGALISHVMKDTGAEKAGIKPGDIIVGLNGRNIANGNDLRMMVAGIPPGEIVKITVVRKGERKDFDVKLSEFPDETQESTELQEDGGEQEESEKGSKLFTGVEVQNIDPDTRKRLDMPKEIKGALVTSVDRSSKAAQSGLEPGMVIVQIGDTDVANAKDAVDATKKIKSKMTRILVWTPGRDGGAYRFLVVKDKEE
jgi:serine protease Do